MVDFESNIMLVYKVFNNVYKYCQEAKDDLIQEGMMGLWKACQTFDGQRGIAFSTYAMVCIRNQMGGYMRKENKYRSKVQSLDKLVDGTKSEDTELDFLVEDEDTLEARVRLQDAIEIISREGCREVIEMKLSGMSQKEIAKELNVSEATVSERMAHACKVVKGVFNEKHRK